MSGEFHLPAPPDMFRLLCPSALALLTLAPAAAQPLIFSEYIEGSSNNKALEILNTSAAPYDLAANGVTVQIYINGATSAGSTAGLAGTIAPGDVFVIAHASASATILAQADLTHAVANFNGDDALVLRTGGPAGTVVDVVGQVGFDPGTEWGAGAASTADNTLVRKSAACSGDPEPADPFEPATDYDGLPLDTFGGLGSYSGSCVAGGALTLVQFTSSTVSAGEGDGAVSLQIAITNPSNIADTAFDVVFLAADAGTTGSAGDIGGFSTAFVVAPAGATTASVDVPISDDEDPEPTETFAFQLQNVTGGNGARAGAQDRTSLSVADDDAHVADFVVINEVDADTPGSDTAEFIELYDGGAGDTDLSGLALVLFNGSDNTSYAAFDLDGFVTDAHGLFVAGNAGVPGAQVVFAAGTIQNGADAVALYAGDATAFPNGTSATTTALVDALVYGTADARDADLLAALGQSVQFEEAYRGPADTRAVGRLNLPPGPPGLPAHTALQYAVTPTPGSLNPSELTVDETAGVADVAGWRLLATPLVGALDPLRVGDYASINLVQGVAAGDVHPAQYPGAGANLLTRYDDGSFAPPASTDDALPPGQGFFWYWYDADIVPGDPTGTSRSYDLSNPDFALALTGIPVDDLVHGASYGTTAPVSVDGFYMVGNPFAYPYRLGGTTVDVGVLSSNFYAYDPSLGTYAVLTADFVDPYAGAAVSVWNGAMAEVSGVPAGAAVVHFNTPSTFVDPVAADALIGVVAGAATGEARLELELDRATADGFASADRAAVLRFRADGEVGWDRHDGSKPVAPAPTGQIALLGEQGGVGRRQAVRSLPIEFGDRVDVLVEFQGTVAGTWRLGAEDAGLPQEWSVSLTDNLTGETVDLRATDHTFAAEPGEWMERFRLTVARADVAGAPAPREAVLSAPAPNPASRHARLVLRLGSAQHVRAHVLDALGRRVATLFEGDVAAGEPRVLVLEAGALAPGGYAVRVIGQTFSETRRVVVVR